MDLDFADIRVYLPQDYAGIIVLRLTDQSRLAVLRVFRQMLDILNREPVVMPNHVHGIIVLANGMQTAPFVPVPPVPPVGAQHAAPFPVSYTPRPRVQPGSLGAIVRAFKSAVTQRINTIRRRGMGAGDTGAACCAPTSLISTSSIWQRNYYEHVICDEKALHRLREYIRDNPASWVDDEENPRHQTALAQEKR